LAEVEFQVFSQFGDDGIIQWLLQQLPIPNKTFIEFGVEDYREANTRFLLVNNQWSGLVIDGSEKNVGTIKADQVHTFFDLQAVHSFITVANINELISKARFAKEVGILSVDIDGNDYWVLKAIKEIEPVIIICEYNSLFGFEQPCTIEYKHDFVRGKDFPFQFYGTSLKAAYDLAKEKGYSFIGCNSAGNNAYFIRNPFMQYLSIKEKTASEGYVFANFTEAFDATAGEWLRGIEKIMSINGLPVFNTETNTMEKVDAAAIKQSLIDNNKLKRF
ncbi:MAG: FkbM family methyltransferase, partial [Bacteroidota bacterium]